MHGRADLCKAKASMVYVPSSRTVSTLVRPTSKKKKKGTDVHLTTSLMPDVDVVSLAVVWCVPVVLELRQRQEGCF